MKKIRVGLIVEEYFSKEMGGYGGYGMLARNYISKYIPNDEIELEIFIGRNKSHFAGKTVLVDGIKVNYIPRNFRKKYFKNKNIDVYLSVETNRMFYEVLSVEKEKPIVLFGQDPRPYEDWEKIKSVPNQSEYEAYTNYYSIWEDKIREVIHEHLNRKNLYLISQGKYLMEKMIKLYNLPENISIDYVPNPMEFTFEPSEESEREKEYITFLGRLDTVKRPWIFFELAKRFPKEKFIVCGQTHEPEIMNPIIEEYKNVGNLVFKGHVSGEKKEEILKKTKILVNTSIHEAIPISFLEAISYGAQILSCQNPDNITSENGRYTGVVLGEGKDSMEIFESLLNELLEEKLTLDKKTESFKSYKELYSIDNFVVTLRSFIKKAALVNK